MAQIEGAYGGGGASPTESVWIPNASSWIDTGSTLPAERAYGAIAKVSDTWYYYGGWNVAGASTDTIWTSTDLITWSVSGNVFPTTIGANVRAIVTPNYVNVFSPGAGVYYRAPIATPTVFDPVAKALPLTRTWPLLFICNDAIYWIGGYNGGVTFDTIHYISLADFEAGNAWTPAAPQVFPTTIGYGDNIGAVGDMLVQFGGTYNAGTNGASWIHTASIASPLVWTRAQATLNDVEYDALVVPAGPRMSIISEFVSTRRHTVHSMIPWSPVYEGNAGTYEINIRNFCLGYKDGYIYSVGGVSTGSGNPTNKIQRTRSRVAATAIVDPTQTRGRPVTLEDGQAWSQSASERAGMLAWFHHAYAPRATP